MNEITRITQVKKIAYRLSATGGNKNKVDIVVSYDQVIIEQPLQITLQWYEGIKTTEMLNKIFSITMRTPGDDKQLILGLLFSESVIKSLADIDAIFSLKQEEQDEQQNNDNQWQVNLVPGVTPNISTLERYQPTYSSCGLCGTTSIKKLELKQPVKLSEKSAWLEVNSLFAFSSQMRKKQQISSQTGSAHAAMLFDEKCQPFNVFEDIGRHNAVDKVVGEQLLISFATDDKANNTDTNVFTSKQQVLLVSSRLSFEIVQKAIMASIPVLVGAGAPSNLAILAAKRFDLTLIGFCSANSFNVYHGHWRLQSIN